MICYTVINFSSRFWLGTSLFSSINYDWIKCMKEVNSGKYLSIMGMINMKWKFDWEDLRRQFINIRFNLLIIEWWSYLGVALGCIINRSHVETRFFSFFFVSRLQEELNFNDASLYSKIQFNHSDALTKHWQLDQFTAFGQKMSGFRWPSPIFSVPQSIFKNDKFLTASNVNI